MTTRNYAANANSDARDMLLYFLDEIAEQARAGDVSTDFNNDYPDGDSYHHVTHVDRHYSLSEAAAILDALADDEETDSGLWEGLEPRQAISVQAAYTYGNAVACRWQALIDVLNGDYLAGEDDEDRREGLARLYVLLVAQHDADRGGTDYAALANEAHNGVRDGDLTGVLVLCDWLEEHGRRGHAELRAAAELAKVKAAAEENSDE